MSALLAEINAEHQRRRAMWFPSRQKLIAIPPVTFGPEAAILVIACYIGSRLRSVPRWQRIVGEVCLKHNIDLPSVMGTCRQRPYVRARWEIMARLRAECRYTLPHIARIMGGLDHTTVLHGLRCYAKLSA